MGSKPRPILTLTEYQRSMERFERSDGTTLPDIYLAVRIDAHRTGPEWDDRPDSEYPFGAELVSSLFATAQELMCSGFRVLFGFVHGDEITLLFDRTESTSQRRRGRIASLVASYGAVAFLRASPRAVAFHSQLAELPAAEHAVDYFMWQRKVATRNFFSRSLGIALAERGQTPQQIESVLKSLQTDEQRFAAAAEAGIERSAISQYHRFGCALWWERLPNDKGFRLHISDQLHESDEDYRDFLLERIEGDCVLPDTSIVDVPRKRILFEQRPLSFEIETETVQATRPKKTPDSKVAAIPARGNAGFRIGRKNSR